MLRLDFSNMMSDVIGEKGISKKQVEQLKDVIGQADAAIKTRAYPGLDFIDLTGLDTTEIKEAGRWIRGEAENFLILGIGGSALGPKAILEALSQFHNLDKKPRVFIYDNVDPKTLSRILSLIDIRKTIVNVITKSGSTAETMSSFMVLWDVFSKVSPDAAKGFIATTDPEKGNLRRLADEKGIKTLPVPPGVGGRYSVLSAVGLLLSEVIGVDSGELLKGAKDMHDRCSTSEIFGNPAYLFGTLLYLMEKKKKRSINVLIPYADCLKPLSEWFCQLWAESLGKNGIGLTPYPSLGTVDQHSQLQLWMEGPEDKAVIFIRIGDYGVDITIPHVFQNMEGVCYLSGHSLSELIKAEEESTELALSKAGRPNMTINMPQIDAYHMGQLFYFFELTTAFTGFLYGINPFDQPGVEEGKNFTYGMMGKKGYEGRKEAVESARKNKGLWGS